MKRSNMIRIMKILQIWLLAGLAARNGYITMRASRSLLPSRGSIVSEQVQVNKMKKT